MKYDIKRYPIISGKYQGGYRKPRVPGDVKGKRQIKFLKRLKVKMMKAAGHLRGDNRPLEWKVPQ